MLIVQSRRWLWLGVLLFALIIPLGIPHTSHATVKALGQRGCADGTVVGGPNLIANGDFSTSAGPGPDINPAAGFTSELKNRGPNKYPNDGEGVGFFSIWSGNRTYDPDLASDEPLIIGRTFPGDSGRDIPATETYFYSNPVWELNTEEILLWRQEVTVVEGTTYNFYAYFDNLINVDIGAPSEPVIELRVDGQTAGPAVVVPEAPDQWVPVQFAFTTDASQTSATLEIYDLAGDQVGDDFAMTQINLRQCVSGLGVAKALQSQTQNDDDSYDIEYLITLQNYGSDPAPLSYLQVTDDLKQVFANASDFSVIRLESNELEVNSTFDGITDKRLLLGNDALQSQTTATITLGIRVQPGTGSGGYGPFNNSVSATAKAGDLEIDVGDVSSPGTDPDPDGDENPKDDNQPTKVYLRYDYFLPIVVQ